MASTVEQTPALQVADLLRKGSWQEICSLFERELSSNEKAEPEFRLSYAIALIRSGREGAGISRIDAGVLAAPNARRDLRRYVISPLLLERKLDAAAKVLDLLIAESPDCVEDLRLRASVLARLRRWPESIKDARHVVDLCPDDLAAHTSYVQILLQAGRNEEAGAHAETVDEPLDGGPRTANIFLLALVRSGRTERAAEMAVELSESDISDELVAVAIVRTLLATGRIAETIDTGERCLMDGWDDPALRSCLGQAYMASQLDDRYEKAIAHFEVGLDLQPDDVAMNSGIGEALLRLRNYDKALLYLERARTLQPNVAQARALYARALKQAGRYDEAAAEFRQLLEQQPSSSRWRRYAAGVLSQAGRREEAAKLFDAFVGERRRDLPKSFGKGLEALWGQVDGVSIPQARFDWAWQLSNSKLDDRGQWEARARWGHLADHYLLDWLECRHERAHEAMERLADLSEAEAALSSVDRSKGIILASAHIGPMYAGPLALELLGVNCRWLASTPSVARTAYARSLISTSDQDDMQVAREFMMSLKRGYAVVIAVDGAINLAAPRIQFEGQEITYSSFAARTAHRLGVASLFCAPKWQDGRIGFVLTQLPDPYPGESADSHADRWREAYLSALREYLGGEPENLRLSGGIWRHIR